MTTPEVFEGPPGAAERMRFLDRTGDLLNVAGAAVAGAALVLMWRPDARRWRRGDRFGA